MNLFKDMVYKHGVLGNKEIISGQASRVSDSIPQYLNSIYRSSSKAFPPQVTYGGLVPVQSPKEAYSIAIRASGGKLEVSSSSMIPYAVKMNYVNADGSVTNLPERYQLLPHIAWDNTIEASNGNYLVKTKLIDPMFAPDGPRLFLGLLKTKTKLSRVSYPITVNGSLMIIQIATGKLYKGSKRIKGRGRIETSLVHYLLCKYTIVEVFKKYLDMDIRIITDKTRPKDDEVIIKSNLPTNEYSLVLSKSDYEKDHDTANIFAAAIMMVIDSDNTNAIRPKSINMVSSWRFAMAHILFGKDTFQDERYHTLMEDHLFTINSYVDAMVRINYETQFNSRFGELNDVQDLFFICTKYINYWLTNRKDPMFSPLTDVKYSLLYLIIENYHRLSSDIVHSNTRQGPSLPEVQRAIHTRMPLGTGFKTTKASNVDTGSPHALHPFLDGSNSFKAAPIVDNKGGDLPPNHPTLNLDRRCLGIGSPLSVTSSNVRAIDHPNPYAIIVDDRLKPNQ